MTRKFNMLLLFVLLFGLVPFAWLMLDTSTKTEGAKPVTISQLRALARSWGGPKPIEARFETIGRRHIISDLLAAGSGLRPVSFTIRAYELVYPDGRVVTIDRGMSRVLADRHRVHDFDPVAQARVTHAVAKSHPRLLLSFEPQHSNSATTANPRRSPCQPDLGADPDAPYAFAPGVVVIPADGVTRGDCMIYTRLDDGREILFAGDIAATNASWSELRPPARLITTFLAPRDREQIVAWLRTIQKFKMDAPALHIISGHDAMVSRVLKHGFISDIAKLSGLADDKRLARHRTMR